MIQRNQPDPQLVAAVQSGLRLIQLLQNGDQLLIQIPFMNIQIRRIINMLFMHLKIYEIQEMALIKFTFVLLTMVCLKFLKLLL